MLRRFEHSQIYHPTREWETAPGDLARPFEDLTISTADGVRLSAWFFPADGNSPRRDLAILVCHGNGGNISHRLDLTRVLLAQGAAVLLFDYRGYGHSDGKLSEEGTYADAQAVHAWLSRRGFARIVAFGESLGGAIATELALRESLAGLVLQSTFTSIADLGTELFPWLPVRLLNTIKYDTLAKLPRTRVPVMVMHSRNDNLIRYHHGERLFATANEPKLFWELRGGHNYSSPQDHERLGEGAGKFLALLEELNLNAAGQRAR
jgi:pimeloyl-ACP methyl ester carboxylesterase